MHHHDHAHLLSHSWDFDHVIVWMLPLALLLYAYGFRRVHRQMPERYPLWRLASFAGGLAVVFLAVASPLHAWGEVRLYLHMTQHMLLTMLAPPLLWMGQPIVPMLRAFPPRLVRRIAMPLVASALVRRAGRAIVHPVVCWTALSAAIVVWHLPRSYELVLHSAWWHDVQHACFFGGALLFWWPVIGVWPSRPVWPRWSIIPYLVSADLINTAQSAILSFSSSLLYPSYAHVLRPEGFTALNDQMLAGVIMWVPGSIAFLLPAIALTMQLFERAQPSRQFRSRGHDDMQGLIDRIRSEYLEMPGLRLNAAQAARLWALDRHTSEGILERLAGAGFLFKNKEGAYVRA